MAGIRINQLPEKLTAPEQGDFFVIDDGTAAQKVDFDTLAASVLESYDGSTLGGTAQSVQDAINGREAVDTNGTYTNLVTGVYYIKKHGFVNITAYKTSTSLTANTWNLIGTLPTGYRPSRSIHSGTVIGNSGNIPALVRVQTDGTIHMYTSTAINSALIVFNITFAVAEEE